MPVLHSQENLPVFTARRRHESLCSLDNKTVGWSLGAYMEDFETLYNDMLPVVYRYATARLGTSAGEDLTSEVFHAAAVAIRDGRHDEITSSWIMAVAKNKVIDHWRKQERRNKLAHLVEPQAHDLVELSAETMASAQWSDVMVTLDQLGPKNRSLLLLRYVDDLSIAELAQRSGMSESAAESALARARRAFRGLFQEATG